MKIYLASDHAGFQMKETVKAFLLAKGYEVTDCGATEFDPADDYPVFVAKAAQAVSDDPEESRAVIFGKTGQGEDMVADKFPHVRSAEFYGGPLEVVELSRKHNDANILSIGAGFITPNEAVDTVILWLSTPFSGEERHVRRIEQIENLKIK